MLKYDDGRPFAQGTCQCTIGTLGRSRSTRLILNVLVEGIKDKAVIDTGGVYLVCSREISEYLRSSLPDQLVPAEVNIRGAGIKGTLYRLTLSLLADKGQGESLDLDVTALLPEPDSAYDLPTMLGLMGCLEFLRFALDPSDGTFHFGAI
jgi:hypothetical protein